MATKGSRKRLKTFGTHGRSVRVFVETFKDPRKRPLVRAEWNENGRRRTESLPHTRENQRIVLEYAQGTAERLALHGRLDTSVRTLGELVDAYRAAHPVGQTWKPKSDENFIYAAKILLGFFTPSFRLDSMTPALVDRFRRHLGEHGHGVTQIGHHVQRRRSLYRFAKERKHVAENPIADYVVRVAADQRPLKIPEWTAHECAAILSQLDWRKASEWRAYVAIIIDMALGTRSSALLNLEWRDVDMKRRAIRWRRELDKVGNEREQPMTRDVVRALRIAKVWRRRIRYTGPYVIPGGTSASRGEVREKKPWELDPKNKRVGCKPRAVADKPYTYSALNRALRCAADRAEIPWIPYRAMHGFRRYAVNEVLRLTGNLVRAGQWVDDTDIRTLQKSYVRERPELLREVAAAIEVPAHRPARAPIDGRQKTEA